MGGRREKRRKSVSLTIISVVCSVWWVSDTTRHEKKAGTAKIPPYSI